MATWRSVASMDAVLHGLFGSPDVCVPGQSVLLLRVPPRHQTWRGGGAQPHLSGHHLLQPQWVSFLEDHKERSVHVGELLALLNENYQIANPHLAEPEVLALLKEKANLSTTSQAVQHAGFLQPHGPWYQRHALAVHLQRGGMLPSKLHHCKLPWWYILLSLQLKVVANWCWSIGKYCSTWAIQGHWLRLCVLNYAN